MGKDEGSWDGLEYDSIEALAWQRAQDAATAQRLRSWSGREALVGRLKRLLGARTRSTPRPGGELWFAGSEVDGEPALTVRDSPAGPERVLLPLGDTQLDWFFPSPDGHHVALGRSVGGDEQSTLSIVDVERGRELPERIEFASFAGVAWLPDGSGFYYSAGTAPDTVDSRKHIWFHRLGATPPAEPEPVPSRVPFCVPAIAADGRYVACQPSEVEPRPDHVLDRRAGGGWRPFLAGFDGVFVGFFEGERFVAVTSDGAPRGRVVSIPVASPADRADWVELIPESEAVLRGAVLVAGRMLVMSLVDTSCRLALHELDGRLVTRVPLPNGPIGLDDGAWTCEPPVAAGRTQVSFTLSSPTTAPVGYVYDVAERELTALEKPAVRLEHAVVKREARAWLVHRRDLDLSTPQPVLLHAYGGWNAAFMPVWPGALAAFVEAGGILALANLRGGGELGYDFWREGRRERKQSSYDDLYAIAEELIERGITTPDRLALVGASNGGLLAAAAVTQRPELWRVVASLVPVSDLVGFARDDHVAQAIEELGDPADPEVAARLVTVSPLHCVRAGAGYPATLVACVAADVRCPPWHSRVLVAAMQNATSGSAPICLRVWTDGSHMSHQSDLGMAADWLGFVMEQLELDPAPGG
jgi:prolyl oligopeptidase